MARRRIFARKRTAPRWPLAALLSLVLVGLVSVGGVALLRRPATIPACSAEHVRQELRDMLRERAELSAASEFQLVDLNEDKRVFQRDRMQARHCAATADIDGARESFRFRITRDDEQGYVLTLRGT